MCGSDLIFTDVPYYHKHTHAGGGKFANVLSAARLSHRPVLSKDKITHTASLLWRNLINQRFK